jgi:hypothetical protein
VETNDVITENIYQTLRGQGIPSDWFTPVAGGYKYNGTFSVTAAGSGMEINLTEPSIKWGSGTFEVDANGHLMARGATFYGITNLTNSEGDSIPAKTEIKWQKATKKVTATGLTESGWTDRATAEEGFDAAIHNLWMKVINTTFSGAETSEIINTTGPTGS